MIAMRSNERDLAAAPGGAGAVATTVLAGLLSSGLALAAPATAPPATTAPAVSAPATGAAASATPANAAPASAAPATVDDSDPGKLIETAAQAMLSDLDAHRAEY